MSAYNTIRRLVTGHDEQGQSTIIEDKHVTNITYLLPDVKECALINLWRIHEMPTKIDDSANLVDIDIPLAPSKNGINFRFVNFPPDENYIHLLDHNGVKQGWKNIGADADKIQNQHRPHPLMHRTKSIDFGIVLLGEIFLILDKEERLLKAGDVVIQRGTNHAWSNRSNSLCRMAFILVDAEEEAQR